MEMIRKYFPDLSSFQENQFQLFAEQLTFWNEKINLISRKDIPHVYERHVLHALSIAKIINFKKSTEIIDVGTGGGFPGVPLAILFPDARFVLVDSITKKIKAVSQIIKELELKNCQPLNARAEKINKQYHFIVSRAVTSFPKFYALTKNKISRNHFNDMKNGIFYLKGGDFSEEIAPFENNIQLFPVSGLFEEEFFKTKTIIYLPSQ